MYFSFLDSCEEYVLEIACKSAIQGRGKVFIKYSYHILASHIFNSATDLRIINVSQLGCYKKSKRHQV